MEHHHHFEGTLHQRSSSIKVILQNRRSSSIKGHLPSKAVFHQRWSSIKGRLRSSSIKVVFPLRSSSLEGRLPSVVFFHPRSSSIKGRLSSQVVLFIERNKIIEQSLSLKQLLGGKALLYDLVPFNEADRDVMVEKMEDNSIERERVLEDDLRGKMTSEGRRLLWKTT